MTLRVVFRRAAQAEFLEAAAWYEQRRNGLGEDFLREVETAIDAAAKTPLMYPLVADDVRRTVTRRFPYSILFRNRGDVLIVLAVFHGRRDPRNWQDRT